MNVPNGVCPSAGASVVGKLEVSVRVAPTICQNQRENMTNNRGEGDKDEITARHGAEFIDHGRAG